MKIVGSCFFGFRGSVGGFFEIVYFGGSIGGWMFLYLGVRDIVVVYLLLDV